ncbi:SDR family oxidoreductase [Clostridium sp. AM58-1XD]|uniref:SDR family oxidoreductase n=1 Tax=Clostridium sp. AM58-1XD TaxID=2292307 RepID=UPI000E4D9F36|nr:SDR family oxidoreductase [Clostridium sp. AM58-1XD]RGY97837.1 SDR family NAD(P)-dependent oxidoreductase [Clostridium sp. AM58-1XD]
MNDLFNLSGKKAIITGGTRGLGRGMAEALMEAGCEAVIIGSSDSVFETAEGFCQKGYCCHGVKADLRSREENYRAFQESLELLGGTLDIMATAAGIQRRHSAEEFPMDEWDEVISINLNSVWIMNQEAGKVMLKKGYGKIINVASMASFFGCQTVPAYAAAKGGVAQLTKELTNDWCGRGINVNAIAPGYMATDLNTALLANEERSAQILSRIPAGRWGTPDDMKGLTVFLASRASDYVSGAIIPVDGGYLVK